MSIDDFNPYVAEDEEWVYCAVNSSLVEKVDRGLWDEYGNIREVVLAQTEDFRLYNTDIKTERHGRPYSVLISLRWVSEKWTSRNNLGDNYVLGGVHYETSASTVHCRVQKERC